MSTTANAGATTVPAVRNDRMAISYRAIDKLWQPDDTPRRYPKADIKRATNIMRKFGVRLPLLIKPDGRVLSHFVAVMAARALGHDQLPVVVADDLTDGECDALSLALARFYELGKFDQALLGSAISALEISTPDMTLDDMGFSVGEGDLAIATAKKGEDKPDPPVEIAPYAVSNPDDIWLCDAHRVGCGDAADREWLARLNADRQPAMAFADKPYSCKMAGFATTRKHREFVQLSSNEDRDKRPSLFRAWCEAIRASVKPGAIVFLCIDWRGLADLQEAATPVFGELLNLVVWVKDRAGLGSLYRSQHELILVFCAPGGKHRNNVELGKHGRHRTNVWNYASAKTFATTGTEGDLLANHATPKNKEMVADAILDVTKRGDVVLDPFLGSGSTLIAADKVGRVCHGGDLDPLFVDVAVRRWQAWSGKRAIHAETGRLFDEVEGKRRAASAEVDHV